MNSIHNILIVISTALMPGIEARGAIPLALALGFDPFTGLLMSYIASSLPSIILVYGLSWLEKHIISKITFARKIYQYALSKARKKAGEVEKYNIVYVGLALYVAIPLPLTGVWTGSLIAHILELNKLKSIVSIFIGNLIACILILLPSYVLITS
ncbi:MAG: ligand-binding protein SH3 [Thermoprotei archaeon]|nr:MAG: ligand-binding protein SH3 [Thermoprotei archaeon]